MTDQNNKEEELKPEKEKDHTRLFIGLGCVITFLWIGAVWILYSETKLPVNWNLNHLGDFLAGAFAPLAVFWFVLGFFLQIKEIRYQRIEINRLGGFTERQAHATEKHVALGEKELENQITLEHRKIEREKEKNRPILIYEHTATASVSRQIRYEVNFKNIGGPALNAEVSSSFGDVIGLDLKPKRNILPNEDTPYRITFRVLNSAILPVPVTLDYSDSDGRLYRHQTLLSVEKKENQEFFNSQRLLKG